MGVFFTSDLHFGHENIVKFAKRPFKDVTEMDETLIKNWNDTVKDGDDLFFVGDLSFHKAAETKKILSRLNGNKYMIRGNHDMNRINDDLKKRFIWVKDLHTIKIRDFDVHGGYQKIVLCHYALRVWDCKHYGSWNLHGHSHGSLTMLDGLKQLDVGCDVWGYKPVSYEKVKKIMEEIPNIPVDYHHDKIGETEPPTEED